MVLNVESIGLILLLMMQSSNGGISEEELLGNTDVESEVKKELSNAKEAALA